MKEELKIQLWDENDIMSVRYMGTKLKKYRKKIHRDIDKILDNIN